MATTNPPKNSGIIIPPHTRQELFWIILSCITAGLMCGLFPTPALVITSLFMLGFSIFIMQKSTMFFQYFTVPSVFFIFYFFFIYAGSFYVYFISSGGTAIKYLVAIHLILLLIPVGTIIANYILKFRPKEELTTYFRQKVRDNLKDSVFVIPFSLIVLFSIGIFATYLFQLPTIPFLSLLSATSSYTELTETRYLATTGFTGNSYLYSLSYSILLPLTSLIALSKWFASKRKTWLITFSVLFFISIFGTLATNQKAPIVTYVVGLFILYTINRGKINYKKTALVLITLLLILLPMVYLLNPDIPAGKERILKSMQGISHRIFLGQTSCLYSYFEVFPNIHPFVYGRTIGDLSTFMGWDCFQASQYVYDWLFPYHAGKGSANTIFIADMYADFGYVIMILSIIFVGFLLQTCQIWLTRSPKTPVNIALLSFLCISFAKLSQTNLFVTLSTWGVIWSIVTIITLKLIYDILNTALRKS